jgi:phenylpyruvate tautomerase PptA (4-oxalocrotonate tautomerase family)
LRLGEPIAENEADRLSGYFVTTTHYREVIAPRTAVFVGRRGAGKTANFIKAANDLEEDQRNLVCRIEPSDYDLDGLVRLLSGHLTRDAKGYVVESLWKYLLISEIALAALDEAHSHPAPLSPGEPAWELDKYISQAGAEMSRDFAVRLERAVVSVEAVESSSRIADERAKLSEALHSTLIHELTDVLVPVLRDRQRVAVLIDNLDQSWEHTADVDSLAQLLLGLLVTARKVGDDLSRRASGNTVVTLGVFIRADIYERVIAAAREPDKIPAQFMTWTDRELLLQVLEERYAASRGAGGGPSELWTRFFEAHTKGQETREYIAGRVLPRPRDVLYLTNSAIEVAVRHRHTEVTADDILAAERQYSQFAFEALLVEGSGEIDDFEELLFEFIGAPEVITLAEVQKTLVRAGIRDKASQLKVVEHLISLSFLGQEIHADEYGYAENPRDRRRLDGLARKLAAQRGKQPQFRIHPAYQAYLDVSGSETPGQQTLRIAR